MIKELKVVNEKNEKLFVETYTPDALKESKRLGLFDDVELISFQQF